MRNVNGKILGWCVAAALTVLLGAPIAPYGPGALRLPPTFNPDSLRAIQRQTDLQGKIQRLREDRMQRSLRRQIEDLRRQHLDRQLKQDSLKYKDPEQVPVPVTRPARNEEQKRGTVAGEGK